MCIYVIMLYLHPYLLAFRHCIGFGSYSFRFLLYSNIFMVPSGQRNCHNLHFHYLYLFEFSFKSFTFDTLLQSIFLVHSSTKYIWAYFVCVCVRACTCFDNQFLIVVVKYSTLFNPKLLLKNKIWVITGNGKWRKLKTYELGLNGLIFHVRILPD